MLSSTAPQGTAKLTIKLNQQKLNIITNELSRTVGLSKQTTKYMNK